VDFPHELRERRTGRHLSQLDLALRAGTTQRHLSFIETGRSRPSREMVLHLAEKLEVPLRELEHLTAEARDAFMNKRKPDFDAWRHDGWAPYTSAAADAQEA